MTFPAFKHPLENEHTELETAFDHTHKKMNGSKIQLCALILAAAVCISPDHSKLLAGQHSSPGCCALCACPAATTLENITLRNM